MLENVIQIIFLLFIVGLLIAVPIDKILVKQKNKIADIRRIEELKKYKFQRLNLDSKSDPDSFCENKLGKDEISRLKTEAKVRIQELQNIRKSNSLRIEGTESKKSFTNQNEYTFNENIVWNAWDKSRYSNKIPKFRFETVDFSHIDNGEQFENYVANNLMNIGFTNVRLTQITGDYGVDILADKEGVLVAFQCKFYSNPVGVQAIQEVVAGKHHYSADIGCVITNSTFTEQAVKLAQSNDVYLYDWEWIERNFPNNNYYEVETNYELSRLDLEDFNNFYYKLYDNLEKFRIYKAYLVAREYDKKKRERLK